MHLTIVNGSPRGKEGNTGILLSYFLRGFKRTNGNDFKQHYLKNLSDYSPVIREVLNSDTILLAFPMCVNSLPGIVKKFIEELENFSDKLKNAKILFLIQSNHSKASQSKYIHRYCKELSARLNSHHLGSIVRCSSLGMRFLPEREGDLIKLIKLGKEFGITGNLNNEIAERYMNTDRGIRFTIPFKSSAGLRLTIGCPENKLTKEALTSNKYKHSVFSNRRN